MRTTPRTRRWAVLGATAALATAAFALPALAQGADEAPGTARPDWAGSAEPGERHAEVLAELEGLDGDAVVERLEELYAERAEVRAERYAEREALRAERHAEVMAELEGLEGEELTEKLEELHAQRHAERAERRAERQAGRDGAGRGFGPRMGMDA